MLGITDYLWRLIPGNPILLRVVESGGKRRRDMFIRCGYLGLLVFLVCFSLISSGSNFGGSSLSELAKVSDGLFRNMSYLQLGLVALLAPIFTAGAITQEKDAQTYDILLSTPLTNGQIVLGSLLSRVFFIIALLVSGIPIFSITQVFGGVAIKSIAQSFGIAAATAMVTGAMAMAIATFKVGTRRTIFSFYLFIVVYLVGGYLLDRVDSLHPFPDPTNADKKGISWLTGLHPFLALRSIFDTNYAPPEYGSLPPQYQHWPLGTYLSNPAGFYVGFMFLLSFLLVTPSILLLRRMAQSTNSLKRWILTKLKISRADRTQKPRVVWSNPIAWREAKTKASAARSLLMRYGFIIAGLGGALVLVVLFASEKDVASYITPTSYKNDGKTETIQILGAGAGTYTLEPWASITFDGKPAPDRRALVQRAAVSLPLLMNTVNLRGTDGKFVKVDHVKGINLLSIPRVLPAGNVKDASNVEHIGVRTWLLGAVIVEFAVILLIVTNASASTVTREKEDGTLDLLLSTPITSRYYIWGKLRGLVSFVMPLVAVPVVSILLFIVYDLFRMAFSGAQNFEWVVFPEAVLILPGTLVMLSAFAAILGMQMSLRCRTTVWAVMSSIGIVAAVCFGLGFCGFSIVESNHTGEGGLVFGAFSPFTLVSILIDPFTRAANIYSDAEGLTKYRVLVFIFGWIATGGYGFLVWTMYKSMVKNFDMTIRKQSR